MKKRRNAWLRILCISIFLLPLRTFGQTNPPVIDFVSDTQSPLFVEKVIHKLNQNEKATGMIFNDIKARHPSCLFILGDVVSLGYDNKKWEQVDAYLKILRNNGVPVYATLGNHELMINAAQGKKRFQARFPAYSPTGYVETIDSVAVILLNSNFSKMKPEAIKKQDSWYKKTLRQLDSDSSVKLVIVGCHHSPYTNSKTVVPSLAVQQKFVAPFLTSKKCVLFLSGHSHNFERFNIGGKQFLVIGGGGGIRQPLHTGKQKTADISGDYKPMFHYIEVTRLGDILGVSSRQLKMDFTGFKEGLTFFVHN